MKTGINEVDKDRLIRLYTRFGVRDVGEHRVVRRMYQSSFDFTVEGGSDGTPKT